MLAGKPNKTTGFILVSANGGLNQPRVAVCNAVAVASLLNATLVVPKFLYSNVWKDPSPFRDIYQQEYFMNLLKDEVNIVTELPSDLQSVDIEAIVFSRLGCITTDSGLVKKAKPIDFFTILLALLLRNRIMHLLGFGSRLGFDPLPFKIQILDSTSKLICKCNLHDLKFVSKIQQAGSLLVRRIRKYGDARILLDKTLLGDFLPDIPLKGAGASKGPTKYLSLHLTFEINMIAYSLCEFGGGEHEQKELKAYREIHFPLLVDCLKNTESVSPAELRKLERCPLTPEEAMLVLSNLGFKRDSCIYLAGSHLYGRESRMSPSLVFTPIWSQKKIFSHQVNLNHSGTSLLSGGHAPTLRPNKKRLAAIFSENGTIGWKNFAKRVSKMIMEGQRVSVRGVDRNIYWLPRCPECMCKG
ncbi:GDP-fucose protein O-fucosyltransferase [Macleaya cordata]|uniref:O-fucosyltransferase family protein n=1 Tax=Macleaya cordata TaxID=56857 RepID=A0A200QXH5_MACCD|nr:GDP-fucose protein O-fucosyltransferase [Macleaya cordata]